jgi:6,7-dimethyl-8-ribityllumazine synthase
MPEFTGSPRGQGRRCAVVVSRFNEMITERYELLVALGAVIRGDTPHFDFVAGEASRGLATAGADFDVPVAFGLLTCDTMAQAEARAGGEHGNKGWDAALAGLEMADLFDQIDGPTED